jgi:hypothetical protein
VKRFQQVALDGADVAVVEINKAHVRRFKEELLRSSGPRTYGVGFPLRILADALGKVEWPEIR